MSIRTTGAELAAFYGDDAFWPKDAWHEDERVQLDGRWLNDDEVSDTDLGALPPAADVRINGGYVAGPNGEDFGSLEAMFRRWRRKQATRTLLIEVPNDSVDEIREAVRRARGKVLSGGDGP